MRRAESGFTIVELLVSLVVVTQVLLAVLLLVDFSSKLARVQTNVADMQQSLRVSGQEIASEIRMAGAGGLPSKLTGLGGAVRIIDNAGSTARIGGAGTPEVMDGTDVLIVRGVFTSPLYHIDPKVSTTFWLDNLANPALATRGRVTVRSQTPTLIPQPLAPLIAAANPATGRPEALILISPRDSRIYSVVELDPANSDVSDPNNLTIAFFITGGTNMVQYRTFSPSGVFHPDLTRCAFLGLLEEHRFYIREERSGLELTPKLSRARTYPGVDAPWNADATNWSLDLADNMLDLQLTMGLDSTNGGGSIIQDTDDTGNDDRIFESADGQNDDWLFNAPSDLAADVIWTNARLHYVRINLLAKADRRDSKYQAPLLTKIENATFSAGHAYNVREQRMFRRRVLQTLVNVRNL